MKILFICTHNRCRSILAEAVTNAVGEGVLTAVSAGSQPEGVVHPLTLQYLTRANISTAGLASKSWDVFVDNKPDLAITVCDSAAGESCPLWLGDCPKVHWGLPDPSRLSCSEDEIAAAFMKIISVISARIRTAREQIQSNDLSALEQIALLRDLGNETVTFD